LFSISENYKWLVKLPLDGTTNRITPNSHSVLEGPLSFVARVYNFKLFSRLTRVHAENQITCKVNLNEHINSNTAGEMFASIEIIQIY